MKKFIITLGMALIAISLNAQEKKEEKDKKKKIQDVLEAVFGGNYSDASGDPPKTDPLIGIVLGIRTKLINLSDEIDLGIGAEFSMQGNKRNATDYVPGGNYSSSTHTSRRNYVNFPVLARYQKPEKGFFAEAGIQPGILISAKNKGTSTSDIKDQLNTLDVGLPVGIGYKINKSVAVGARYTQGLSNVNKIGEAKNQNTVVSLRASLTL